MGKISTGDNVRQAALSTGFGAAAPAVYWDFGRTGEEFFALGLGTIWYGRKWPPNDDSYARTDSKPGRDQVAIRVKNVLENVSAEEEAEVDTVSTLVFGGLEDVRGFGALLEKYSPEARARVLNSVSTVVAGWDVTPEEEAFVEQALAKISPRAARLGRIFVRNNRRVLSTLRGERAALVGERLTEMLIRQVDRFTLDTMQRNGEIYVDAVREVLKLYELRQALEIAA